MKAVLASKNPYKLAEIQAILSGLGVEVVMESKLGLDIDVDETGTTFEENSRLKAEAVMRAANMPAIADDSGLMVDALGGEPGVYSARYAGVHGDDAANNARLMEKMAGVTERGAQFVSAIALARPGVPLVVAEGVCRGTITDAPRGENGFGYDPYFVPEGMTRTFAELPAEVKNGISHRARALDALKKLLTEEK